MKSDSKPLVGSIELKFALYHEQNLIKGEALADQGSLQTSWHKFLQAIYEEASKEPPNYDDDSDDASVDFEGQDYEHLVDTLTISNDDGYSCSDASSIASSTASSGSESDVESGFESDEQAPSISSVQDIQPLGRHESSLLPKSPKLLQVPTAESTKNRHRRHSLSRRRRSRENKETVPRGYYEFNSRSQVVGITYLEIVKATDLPPLANMTHTGFDMDPFVVTSFGKKTFRTAWRRHTLNPIFNESLMFPVMNHERGFSINFTIMDKDRITLNDHVATIDFPIQKILETAPQPDPHTLLYNIEALGVQQPHAQFSTTSIPVSQQLDSQDTDITGYNSSDSSAARASESSFLDSADTGSVPPSASSNIPKTSASSVSLNVMAPPSSMDSQRRKSRIRRRAKKTNTLIDAHMFDFVIPLMLMKTKFEGKHKPELHIRARFLPYAALRQQFWRGLIRLFDTDRSNSMNIFEIMELLDQMGATLSEKTIKSYFTRFHKRFNVDELTIDELVICLEEQILKDTVVQNHSREQEDKGNSNKSAATLPVIKEAPYVVDVDGMPTPVDKTYEDLAASDVSEILKEIYETKIENDVEERLIRVLACPFCGQPRLNNKAEIDIVTHLATCASQDWSRDNLMAMNKFVSSNQARKRWYTKMVFKVTYGNYKLGANSANILVQDRETGFIQEEKMNAYVRLGIRLLYKGLRSSRMESKRIRGILRRASFKQGRKYDDPSSVRAIEPFIKFHALDLSEVLLPLDKFKSFNEFFYRKLKPGARVLDGPDNPCIAVSPADCRSTYFNSISRATEIWIKGKEFSIERLFGDAYPEYVSKYNSGSLAIFRLAPQDYHRFHVPVNGILGAPRTIEGEYYTVNPMAIRSALDVFGENVRVLVPIHSDEFGLVMVVCVGAMMVGSTVITAKAGDRVERMEELGYFQFGGSTLVVLFEHGKIKFDRDLLDNSSQALETLVKVGMSIGHTPNVPQFERHDAHKTPNIVIE